MIAGKDVFNILGAIVPMYFPPTIAYITVRWFNLFTDEQSAGINRFVRLLAIPFLCFHVISTNNLLAINLKLFAADSLQKLVFLAALFLWNFLCKSASLDWVITLFSLSCLPNTLIIGLPMTTAMYGQASVGLMIQTVVFQGVIWVNVLIVLFEYRAARLTFVAESSKLSRAEIQRRCGFTKLFPEETEVSVVCVDGDGNEGFPAKETRPIDDGSGFEKDVVRSEHTSSTKGTSSGMTKFVVCMLWKKIRQNPITYSSLLGIIWSLISFKYNIKLPTLLQRCVLMFSDTGQALALFSLGIFMAAQPNIIACSILEIASAMLVRFLVSPMLVAAISKLVDLHGIALYTAILQAAFPPGIVSFVLAKEYNVHPNIISTSVVFGMLIAFPIILSYYLLLGAIFE
ncbi:probable auxin efflux carrier component 1b [Benincasa hispida]|uniref:probable auxin efflux carrier component 1b n=1 Tax=Benincasa hispida TaxID=102211 RepID=UPI00190293ED|nr:probable auxin efflux carrier component 1b [Benincasa hispida]